MINSFVTCYSRGRDLLYNIYFLHAGIYNIGFYPEELVPEDF